jgi:hypothetical protein
LETWAETFATSGAYPSSWRRHPSLILPHRPSPQDVQSAVPYLSYLERRDLLRSLRPHPRGIPLQTEELEKAFVRQVPWEAVRDLARQRYADQVAKALESKERDRASLFSHYLSATASSLMIFYQWRQILPNRFLAYRLVVRCPDSDLASCAFRTRYAQGQITELPPYFPGDSCRLLLQPVPSGSFPPATEPGGGGQGPR